MGISHFSAEAALPTIASATVAAALLITFVKIVIVFSLGC
jgi:hypothetical protein